MPTDDVSDLRDVVDAINKLCDTMKTSYDYDNDQETKANPEIETEVVQIDREAIQSADQMEDAVESWSEPTLSADIAAEMYYSAIAEASLDMWNDSIGVNQEETARTCDEFYNARSDMEPKTERLEEHTSIECRLGYTDVNTGPPKVAAVIESETPKESAENEIVPTSNFEKIETSTALEVEIGDYPKGPSCEQAETQSITSDERKTEKCETEAAAYETASEMYYTASSEVSLLSDTDLIEKANEESDKEKSDKNIMAGHVAAMRERFESMTRANTPCPDLGRSLSPSLDMFRNITPSPDFLDKS